eukprot:SAG22_NODE_570_length_9013_cov_4.251739_9_plen_101_part_00
MVNATSSCQLDDLALAVSGPNKQTFNISVSVEDSGRCSDPDSTNGYRYTGAACFVATSYYRPPGADSIQIVGRIDESRYMTMGHPEGPPWHSQAGARACL